MENSYKYPLKGSQAASNLIKYVHRYKMLIVTTHSTDKHRIRKKKTEIDLKNILI